MVTGSNYGCIIAAKSWKQLLACGKIRFRVKPSGSCDIRSANEATQDSSLLQRLEESDFLAPLRRAAEEAKSFAKKIRDHGMVRGGDNEGAYAKAKEFVLKPRNITTTR